jgi:hypothetical protein
VGRGPPTPTPKPTPHAHGLSGTKPLFAVARSLARGPRRRAQARAGQGRPGQGLVMIEMGICIHPSAAVQNQSTHPSAVGVAGNPGWIEGCCIECQRCAMQRAVQRSACRDPSIHPSCQAFSPPLPRAASASQPARPWGLAVPCARPPRSTAPSRHRVGRVTPFPVVAFDPGHFSGIWSAPPFLHAPGR